MASDADIADFIINLPSNCYSQAYFTDWFKPYLFQELMQPQRSIMGHASDQSVKHGLINQALQLLS